MTNPINSLILDAIQDSLPFGIVVLNPEREIQYINPNAAALFGLNGRAGKIIKLDELLKDQADLLTKLDACLEETSGCSREMFLPVNKEQKIHRVRVNKLEDAENGFSGYLLQFNDISQQRRMESDLASAKESVAKVVDTLKDYYFETDIMGVVTNINQAFCQQLGYTRKEDVIGKHLRHFTDRNSVRLVYQNFSKVFTTKETVEVFQYTYHTKDGRAYIGETTISPILDGDQVTGARGVMRDVTERVRSEQALLETTVDLEARAKELSVINRIATLSGESLNLNHVLQALCEELAHIFPVRNAGVGIITEDKESIKVVAFHSEIPDEESILEMLLPLEGNIAFQEVIREKKAMGIQDSLTDPRMRSLAGLAAQRGTKSIMIVPLLSRGTAIGTIWMPAMNPEYVFMEKDIALAQIIASQIAAAIDNAQLFAMTENALDRVERDMEIGRAIQSGFFPENIPVVPGWEIATHFQSARFVSGDFYDVFPIGKSNKIAFIIADVCDKGVGAALFMVLFRSLFRAFSQIPDQDGDISVNLQRIIENTNEYITRIHGDANMFATVFFGILDPESGSLSYVNGGHEPPVLLNNEGKILSRLRPTGPAIGLFGNANFQVVTTTLNPGDFFVGYTDGILDAENNKGNAYSEERFLKYIQCPWTSLFSMVFEIKNDLAKFEGEQLQFDDITLLSFRRKPSPFQEKHAICRNADSSGARELIDFCEAAASESNIPEQEKTALMNAVEKSCEKILQYGYVGREPGYLSLFFERNADEAFVIIRDDGKPLTDEIVKEISQELLSDKAKDGISKTPIDKIAYGLMKNGGNQFSAGLTRRTKQKET